MKEFERVKDYLEFVFLPETADGTKKKVIYVDSTRDMRASVTSKLSQAENAQDFIVVFNYSKVLPSNYNMGMSQKYLTESEVSINIYTKSTTERDWLKNKLEPDMIEFINNQYILKEPTNIRFSDRPRINPDLSNFILTMKFIVCTSSKPTSRIFPTISATTSKPQIT